MKELRRLTPLTCAFGAFGMGAMLVVNVAIAYTSDERRIDNFCLDPDPAPNQYCAACHEGSSSTRSEARAAYRDGDLCYFCPTDSACVTGPSCTDSDGDGYSAEGGECGPIDCGDDNAGVHPGAVEICTDGIDNNCDGLVDIDDPAATNCPSGCTDLDGDGFSTDGGACGAIDCDDTDPAVNPGAAELCTDGIDNNCNGLLDTADPNAVRCPTACRDRDRDGYSPRGGSCGPIDCNDRNPAVNPGEAEVCNDRIDNDCNRRVDRRDPACRATGRDDDDNDDVEDRDDDRDREDREDSRDRDRDDRDRDD